MVHEPTSSTVAARAWLATFRPQQPRARGLDYARGALGAFVGILVTALVGMLAPEGSPALPWIVAPLGASSVLLFAVPASPLAQPWSALGGNCVSAVIGIAAAAVIPYAPLAVAVGVGGAIAAMLALRCLHPPGGAVALTAAYGSAAIDAHGIAFTLWPVGLNTLCIVVVALAFNNLTGRRYPHVVAPVPRPAPAGVQPADVEAAIDRLDRGLDIAAADVIALVRDAEANALDRRLGALRVVDVMVRDVIVVGRVESVFRVRLLMNEHGVKALPVVASDGRLAGIVSIVDLFNQDPGDLTSVASVMTSPVTTIRADAPVADLVALMTDRDLRHVPVVDEDDLLVGLVTRAELIAAMHRALVGATAGG